jgi:DNA-binding HxlR family transcriptional regulator
LRSSRPRNVRCRRCSPVPEEVRRTAELLERRWALSILYASIEGAVRFNEFRESVGRVPPATLTTRLNELVEAGLLERRVLDTRPPAVEYRLTTRGRRFEPLLRELVRCTSG